MIRFAITTAGLVALVLASTPADACRCMPPQPPRKALKSADAVFRGTVVRVEKRERDARATFKVVRYWKGPVGTRVKVSAGDSRMCGYGFSKGKSYLVYASRADEKLSTSSCTRTRLWSGAQADRRALGKGKKPKKGG